ncbi:MAG: hypothetical protein QOD46_1325, partial [Actinomycetota bacterium]|nr:hypothetical protein [Actinomycetota bacterium]
PARTQHLGNSDEPSSTRAYPGPSGIPIAKVADHDHCPPAARKYLVQPVLAEDLKPLEKELASLSDESECL